MMDALKKHLRNFLRKHAGLRVWVRKVHVALKESRYSRIAKNAKVDNKMVVFETFMGRQYGCNPKAIYEYMLTDSRFDDYRLVWVLENPDKAEGIKALERAEIVKAKSDRYYEVYASAGYVITNSNLDYGIKKSPEQIFLQTWHGTPLKKLRCDIEAEKGNALNSLDEIKQKNRLDVVRYDYFISPSAFATEKFITAFDLAALNKTDILVETGYPRNDLLFNFDEKYSQQVKESLGIAEDKRKIILYAPTFRDNQHDGAGYTYDLHLDFNRLKEGLSDEYLVLFRAHYFIANQFDFDKYKGFVLDVSGLDDITPLYTIADLLVTDYSSVFFDYACLKRPMVFYMYDLDEYEDAIRGFYLDTEELPGSIVKTEEELTAAIKEADNMAPEAVYDSKYEAFASKYNYLEDGGASKRVCDILFTTAGEIPMSV
ncbi:MAG: CDP-glycerol glycerophosphotransferase family protein [Lentihominibacter sp.]|jgi:CDP-glycerol glycerophosphotransferase